MSIIVERRQKPKAEDSERSMVLTNENNTEPQSSSLKALSDIVINIKYAKFLPEKERRETWEEVCERHKAMFVKKFPAFADALDEIYKNFIVPKRILPSMRGLQFAGAPVVKNNARIYNCAFLNIDSPIAFGEIMFLLMSGCGVGFSVQKHHIERLPTVGMDTRMSYVHRIPDTTEGWADAVKALMLYYFSDKEYPLFDYELIRLKGAPLSSGGKAPGPEPLRKCLQNIDALMRRYVARACAEAGLVNGNARVPIDPITVHDVVCHISVAVLSGGIRRSALLSLFSLDDDEMRKCKHGEWWVTNPQRGRANNSAALYHGRVSKDQWKSLWSDIVDSHCGEPGAYWSNNDEMGCNPCCVSGETWVLTDAGVVQAKDLDFESRKEKAQGLLQEGNKKKATEELEAVARLEKAKVYVGGKAYRMQSDGFFKSGEKPLYRVRTERGFEIDLTADHLLRVVNPVTLDESDDGWKQVARMIEGETLVRLSDQSPLLFVDASGEQSYVGEAEAVGSASDENEDRHWPGAIALMPSVSTGYQYGKEAAEMLERGGEPFVVTPGWVSDDVHRTSYHFQVQFVRGFLQRANTYLHCQEPEEACFLVVEHPSRHNLRQLQNILLRLGIVSTVAESKAWQHTQGVDSGALFNLIVAEDGDGLRETKRILHKVVVDKSKLTTKAGKEKSDETTETKSKTKVLVKHSKDSLATLARLIPDDGQLTLIERLKSIAKTRSRKDYIALFGVEPPSFKRGERFIDRVVEIKLLHNGEPQPCYDVTVEKVHEFDANGFRAHNCEIGLHSMQFCNLVEINAATIESQEDFEARCKAAAILGTLQAAFTDFKYLRPEWKTITEKERLIGVGMTGVACRSVDKLDLRVGSEVVRKTNIEVSSAIGINPAARLTTLKPAGTSSTVLQCSSGVHSWHSEYYWRRIQLTKQEALYRYLADNFPLAVEDSVYDKSGDQAVARVPVAAPAGAILRTEESLKSFLERVSRFNVEWVRAGHNSGDNANNVSATITFNESTDADWLGEWLWDNRHVYHGLSVLPEDLGSYTQTPFEEITQEEYENARDYLSSFDITQVKEHEDNTTMSEQVACAGGVCELISSRS